jgi:uncharacterized membrane protein
MTWSALLVLAAGTWVLKAAGPVLLAGRSLPPRVGSVVALLPPALLAALVAVQSVGDGQALLVDARLGGVAAAALAVWRGAPFLVVIAVGTATAAGLRLLGFP